jgi:hypothetical protein
VIARSQTPLATAFRRIYGDIALLASRIPGRAAAELGLQTALSAKQTGFAALLRRQRLLMSPHVASLLDEVTEVEDPPVDSLLVGGEENAGERLHRLRGRIVQDTSLMLAETVFPRPVPVREIREKLGDRYALDFVALPDTYDGTRSNWFRSVIAPGGGVVLFERFEPGPAFESFYGGSEPWVDRLPDLTRGHGPDWTALAREVLPHAVLDLVRAATRETPIQLLISAHSELSLLPWPALRIDDHGTRLVERAVLTHSPVLTCLSFTEPPTVEPPGLVCLAPWSGRNRPLKLAGELAVWDLPGSPDDRVLALCDWSDGTATVLGGDLPAVLRAGGSRAGLLHIACHGTGTGLAQSLLLPGPLPAARALSLEWPASVLMASCHVGRLHNPGDAEPLSFVMALLTGGSRCVVASIDSLRDLPAGRAATDVVSSVRDGPARLDVALRDYQLAAAGGVAANLNWALLNTYVR